VRTLEGARSYGEGSSCRQPLPYNSIRDFKLRQTAGRSRVNLAQEPSRMNNYTAVLSIDDDQGGGDHYSFEVTWSLEGGRPDAPAPFFDDVRACQDGVRRRFLSRNSRGAYIDFESSADRRNRNQNQGQGLIRGRGAAKNRNESSDVTYSCVIDPRGGQARSGDYQYSNAGFRNTDRDRLREAS